MSTKDKEVFEAVAKRALKDAEKKRSDAGHAGNSGDGGCRDLQNIVEAWEAGLRGEVPKSLAKYHEVSLKAEEYRQSRLGK